MTLKAAAITGEGQEDSVSHVIYLVIRASQTVLLPALDMKELPATQTRDWDAKSFIYDHRAAMDPSKHPSLLREHGQSVAHHTLSGPPFHSSRIALQQYTQAYT
ncbi:hypothetical protein EDD15DRAFT_562526 [Pisolithus albus]|nr:hypothetical protein EDD15DRAFT_562526 [Pisolithus albus]